MQKNGKLKFLYSFLLQWFGGFLAIISVIIPVYNVETYIRQCLDSIISQTLHDIEIILIDDGSTDCSGSICDEYAFRDDRIIVSHNCRSGLSAARNAGLDMASSPFIMFLDSNDWVEPEFCERAYTTAIENEADLILFTYNCVYSNGNIKKMISPFQSGMLRIQKALEFNIRFAPAIWLGLYNRNLFSDIRFPVGKLHEDTGTTHRVIHAATKIYLINEPLYYYRISRPGSIITENKYHPDLYEMKIRRITDLCNWGFEKIIWNDVLFLMINYGRNEKLENLIKTGHVTDLTLRKNILFLIYQLSPNMFDKICIITGKRENNKHFER